MNLSFLGSSLVLAASTLVLPAIGRAQAVEFEPWGARFQSTYVWQSKRPFSAPYSGANSLVTEQEKSYSFTATAALGLRPWPSGEVYFNPEASQGVPLSNLTGLGGFTNGEMARTSGPDLTLYRARAFLRQTWGLGGGTEQLESDFNQLAGSVNKKRLVLTAGNFSVTDLFDDNAYSHDPRTQFLNWALVTHGAYDFAADARGYTWGAALEYLGDGWAIRAGRFIQPKEPNGQALDRRIFRHYGDQIEMERSHAIGTLPGKIRLLAFRNRAVMSGFREALDQAAASGGAPDINAVRSGARSKKGVGINLEQQVTAQAGVFGRAMWADGRTETYAYTEIDRSISAGALVKGEAWGRAKDTVGVAVARNGLSAAHRDYLAAGGLGFFIGDGRLNYRPETILEGFYNVNIVRDASIAFDWQHVRNPAYNADRGPVNVFTVRLHTEF